MTPLVFVHGFMGGSAQWAAQAPLAEHRDFVCLDLPGFGQNADLPPVRSIEGFAEWALDTLTRQGIERFDLLGHSMGGMIVQEMVHSAPTRVNSLILYGTGPRGLLPGRFETIETSMQRAREDGPRETARRIAATWFLDEAEAPGFPSCAGIAEKAGLPAILAGLEAMRDWTGVAYLDAIRARTLIVWGDGDRTYPWSQIQELWDRIPNANLAVVPACAHAVHMERPDYFNRLIEDFLDHT